MYLTPPGTIVVADLVGGRPPQILIALEEIEGGSTSEGDAFEGGWIVLGPRGIEFLENGIGIYVEDYWEELQTGLD